ncbi:MAG: hypothetical protein O3C13_06835 [Bacteroidetes bacterium]|jgi:hypothetical protein|nr:hypothetical protein [Bacteroidota bacterium]
MKNTIIIASSSLVGCIVIGIFIYLGLSGQRYEYVKENVVFDKKTGTTYFTDKKEFIDTKGDLYKYE